MYLSLYESFSYEVNIKRADILVSFTFYPILLANICALWITKNVFNQFCMFIYIYIYIHFKAYLNNIDIFLSTYFCIYPRKLPYWCCNIQPELVYKHSIINCLPSNFGIILGHHWGGYKSDITFACTLLLCKNLAFIIYIDVLL